MSYLLLFHLHDSYIYIYIFLLQLDMVLLNAAVASDSSDRTKDKSDQKVVLLY